MYKSSRSDKLNLAVRFNARYVMKICAVASATIEKSFVVSIVADATEIRFKDFRALKRTAKLK